MAGQGETPRAIHGDALGQQHVPLDPVAALPARCHSDTTSGIDHPVPRQIGGQGQAPQGPAHLARAPPGTDQLRDLAVGGQATPGDQGHRCPNQLIKPRTFRPCRHQPVSETPPILHRGPDPRGPRYLEQVKAAPGREPLQLAAITLDPAAMPSNEGPTPVIAAGPGAEPPEQLSVQPTPAPPEKGSPLPSPFGIPQSQALGSIAAGASTVFLLGTLATVLLNLFPLQLGNNQWQLSQMGNLVANGSWLLLGLVLLHLAAVLQPSNARLGRRLATARRLAGFGAVLFLALTPLQLFATWNGIDIADTTRNRVVSTTMERVQLLREAIVKARNLADLKQRAASIPNAPPIPPEAATMPFETLRSTFLGQLDVVESNVRGQREQGNPRAGQQAIWRQAIRGAITSLLLALGFASGAEGGEDKPSLLATVLSLFRSYIPRTILNKLNVLAGWQQRWQERFNRLRWRLNPSGTIGSDIRVKQKTKRRRKRRKLSQE